MKPITGNIAIEGKNIVKDFKIGETTTRVLKNVSLKVLKGEFVSIMGQSGSDGKKFKDYRKQLDNILEIVGLSDRRKHTPGRRGLDLHRYPGLCRVLLCQLYPYICNLRFKVQIINLSLSIGRYRFS